MVKGFKSLKDISIEIKPLTILIGLNSSGKSSILQVLHILKQSMEQNTSSLTTTGPLLNLGSFNDIVFQKRAKKEIQFKIQGKRKQFLNPPFSEETRYSYALTVDDMGLKHHESSIVSGEFRLEGKYKRRVALKRIVIPFHNGSLHFNVHNIIGHPFRTEGSAGDIGEFTFDIINRQFLRVIADDLRDFFLIPAIRGVSSPSYPLDNRSSEDLIDVLNLNRQAIKFSSTLVYDSPAMERKINKWINRTTGITIRARTIPDKRASIEAHKKIDVNLINEGFGTNQLIHLFAQIAKAPAYSLIGIEEPEIHLHPKAQSELAKVLIEITKEERKNLILTTHSEHILYRLLIEVAKGNLKPEDFAIYHFKLSDQGITEVEKLIPDEKGRLDKGIPDFLETDLNNFKDFLETLKV